MSWTVPFNADLKDKEDGPGDLWFKGRPLPGLVDCQRQGTTHSVLYKCKPATPEPMPPPPPLWGSHILGHYSPVAIPPRTYTRQLKRAPVSQSPWNDANHLKSAYPPSLLLAVESTVKAPISPCLLNTSGAAPCGCMAQWVPILLGSVNTTNHPSDDRGLLISTLANNSNRKRRRDEVRVGWREGGRRAAGKELKKTQRMDEW